MNSGITYLVSEDVGKIVLVVKAAPEEERMVVKGRPGPSHPRHKAELKVLYWEIAALGSEGQCLVRQEGMVWCHSPVLWSQKRSSCFSTSVQAQAHMLTLMQRCWFWGDEIS